jgi:hypothetical protein
MGVAVCVYVMVALARLLACLRVNKLRLVYMPGAQAASLWTTEEHYSMLGGCLVLFPAVCFDIEDAACKLPACAAYGVGASH